LISIDVNQGFENTLLVSIHQKGRVNSKPTIILHLELKINIGSLPCDLLPVASSKWTDPSSFYSSGWRRGKWNWEFHRCGAKGTLFTQRTILCDHSGIVQEMERFLNHFAPSEQKNRHPVVRDFTTSRKYQPIVEDIPPTW